jgi:hypothetical protein
MVDLNLFSTIAHSSIKSKSSAPFPFSLVNNYLSY